MDKQEISDAIAHQQKMLRALRQRLQQRELQEAQQGINAPPEVISDIHELTERIQRHEGELARLQTEAAVDKEPPVEVEYQALLAEVWGTPQGRPTFAGATRLNLARLRLGILPERAQELEHEVRVALAEEAVANLDARYLPGLRVMIEPYLSALAIEQFSGTVEAILVGHLAIAAAKVPEATDNSVNT
jgi:hypothetical protein